MKLSKRAQNTRVSPIRTLVKPKTTDVRVHSLNIGQPDLPSPKEFFDGVRKFSSPVLAYDSAPGNRALLEQWAKLLNRQYTLSLAPENIVITSGSSEALTIAFNICCDVNDEIIVFSPTYANYTGFATLTGVKLVPINGEIEHGFHLPENATETIEEQISKKTRAILLCNPNNPTGTVYTHEELQTLIDLCEKHDLFLIVDEVYREFVYDDVKSSSVFQLSKTNERVIVVDSISKRYSLCGARIGCLISFNEEIISAATNVASTRVSSPTIEQVATAHMLKHIPDSYLNNAVHEYATRRNLLIDSLNKIPGVEFSAPEGGFYVFVKLPVDDAQDFARFMLQDFSMNNETVFISPANGFFINNSSNKTSYVRIAFVLSGDRLVRAMQILEHALIAYLSMRA